MTHFLLATGDTEFLKDDVGDRRFVALDMRQPTLVAAVSSVRDGFSYERERIFASDWEDFVRQLGAAMRRVADENPDSVVVKMDRPAVGG